MTESMLVTAQLAYVYPRLAELADARGDAAFAAQLRAPRRRAARRPAHASGPAGLVLARLRAATRQIGTGAIFGEPQPWAHARRRRRAAAQATDARGEHPALPDRLGAPGGPARIGSSQSPALDDPDVTERRRRHAGRRRRPRGLRGRHLVRGQRLADVGAGRARRHGPARRARTRWDEFARNTLAAHAHAFPDHWNGILSVDDVCNAWFSERPRRSAGSGFDRPTTARSCTSPPGCSTR